MTSRPSTAAPILAVLAIVLATLTAYVSGYFWMANQFRKVYSGSTTETAVLSEITRIFPHRWQAAVYAPLAKVESWWRQVDVEVTDTDTWES